MIILDLKLVLTLLILIALGSIGVVGWFKRSSTTATLDLTTAQTLIEQLPMGLFLQSNDGAIRYANQAGQRLLQDGTIDATSMPRPNSAAGRAATAQQGRIGNAVPLRWWRFPVATHSSCLVLEHAHDQQRVRQAQTFLGQLIHELRTPLTALIAHAAIANASATDAASRRAALGTVQQTAEHIAHLVRDLLALHRLDVADSLPLQPTNLVLVAEEAVVQLLPQAETCNITIELAYAARIPPVLAHHDQLRQVFLNLLDNALKYSPSGSAIVVRFTKLADSVECSVVDNGTGIAAADLPHVTKRLYRGRVDTVGNGLGLALIEGILHHHGTTLHLTSTTEGVEQGTRASWRLPYA